MWVGIAELFWLRTRFKDLSFLPHLIVKSLAIVACMYAAFLVLNTLDVLIEGISWREYWAAALEPSVALSLLEALGVVAFLLFFVHLDRLLGPGVLIGYVTGRYHSPRREARIFMFLDLKGSTTLADHMDPDRYFAFLHEYFLEMSEPILETNAEIYQYVGDFVPSSSSRTSWSPTAKDFWPNTGWSPSSRRACTRERSSPPRSASLRARSSTTATC